MQLSTERRELYTLHSICAPRSEIGVESDIVLPDYCGDIERILKCTLTPRISSKRIENNKAVISGTAFARMVYQAADGSIASFETQIPFSKSFDVNFEGEDCYASVRLKCEYVNCRAISPRRFEIRAALEANVCVHCKKACTVLKSVDSEIVEAKKQGIEAVSPVCHACESFTVSEDYELVGEPISSVVRMTATPTVLDSKAVSGRLIVKGEIALCIVYLTEEKNEMKDFEQKVPVNHIMTVSGAEEEDIVDLELDILRMSAEPSLSSSGSELSIEILLEACADIKRREEIELIVDAYSVGYESDAQLVSLNIPTYSDKITKQHSFTVSPEVEYNEILDVFAEVINCKSQVNPQGEVMCEAEINVAFLLVNGDGAPFISEKVHSAQFSLGADTNYKNALCDCAVSVLSAGVSPNKRGANISLAATCSLNRSERIEAVQSFELDENRPKTRDGKTALTLYFANEGEDIFDIAKRYNTSARAVIEENALNGLHIDTQRAILIPML